MKYMYIYILRTRRHQLCHPRVRLRNAIGPAARATAREEDGGVEQETGGRALFIDRLNSGGGGVSGVGCLCRVRERVCGGA